MVDTAFAERAARKLENRGHRRYRTPGHLARRLDPRTGTTPALDLLDAALAALMAPGSPDNALAISMPPQEGKSEKCARRFPEWLLDHDPSLRIAIVSYELDLALRWGRETKQDIALHPCRHEGEYGDEIEECAEDCGGLHISIRRDSSAAGRWETPQGGGIYCVGLGGPLTGKPVDILIIDDPVKDRAAAESETLRKSAWDWWESVALTRLAPDARAVLIQCMTGDTPVLMGDGTEKPLRDVRPGDQVATYERGTVTTSTVRNWANQGPDHIFEIRMRSGAVVRANARHPFLAVDENGVETWQRTDSLRPGSRIRRVTGGNGVKSPALAASRPGARAVTARDCACPATTGSAGPMGSARHLSTAHPAGTLTSNTATGSALLTTTGCLPGRPDCAPSAGSRPPVPRTGTGSSASTTAMTLGGYAGCSATTATLSSAPDGRRQPSGPPPTTYVIGLDEVAEIVPCGIEDVYDRQVDRTENFIANGLTSHNTRWHQDDLSGRIFSRPSPLRWRQLVIPAIATAGDDPLGREPGEELISVRGREPGHFLNLRATMSAYVFAGVYQQNPVAPEGNFFRRPTFRYWRELEPWSDGRERIDCEGIPVTLADTWRFVTMDFAASTRSTADYTVAACWAIDGAGNLILLDRARAQVPDHEHFAMAKPLLDRWRADIIYVEQNWWSKTFTQDAIARGVGVAPLRADKDKLTRAIPAAGRVHSGKVWFPAGTSGCRCGNCQNGAWLDEWCDELAAFPSGTNDDQVDVLAYAARVQVMEWTPARTPPKPAALTQHEAAVAAAMRAGTGDGSRGINPMDVPY